MKRSIGQLAVAQRGPVIGIVLLVALILAPQYTSGQVTEGTWAALFGVFGDNAPIALALGLGVILGQFDLSVIATYSFCAVLAIKLDSGPFLGVVAAIVAGALIGGIQGFLVARFDLTGIAVTLGGFLTLAGIVQAWTGGMPVVYSHLDVTLWLTTPQFWAFAPAPLIVAGSFVLIALLLRFTLFGRSARAVGGDAVAARISGVRTGLVTVATFALAGAVAGFGGSLHGFAVSAAPPTVTFAPAITAITAIAIGGMSLAGGRGNVLEIAAGVAIMAMLVQLLSLAAVAPTITNLVTGLFLTVIALLTPQFRDWWRAHLPQRGRSAGLLPARPSTP